MEDELILGWPRGWQFHFVYLLFHYNLTFFIDCIYPHVDVDLIFADASRFYHACEITTLVDTGDVTKFATVIPGSISIMRELVAAPGIPRPWSTSTQGTLHCPAGQVFLLLKTCLPCIALLCHGSAKSKLRTPTTCCKNPLTSLPRRENVLLAPTDRKAPHEARRALQEPGAPHP